MAGEAQVFRLPMRGPDDVSGIASLITSGELDPTQSGVIEIEAVMDYLAAV